MSVNHTTTEENSMFGTPVWERNGKKRRAHSAANVMSRPTVVVSDTPKTTRARKVEVEEAPVMTRTAPAKRRSNSVAQTSAIALGVIIVAGVGAGAWYATQNRDTGVAQLTPGVEGPANTTEVAANTVAPPPAVTPQPATTSASQRVATPARAAPARSRPAAAASAEGSAVDTSATLPDGPMPYSKVSPDAAVAAPAPAQAATPAPAPVDVTPPSTSAADPATVNPSATAAAPTPTPTETPTDVVVPPATQVTPPPQ